MKLVVIAAMLAVAAPASAHDFWLFPASHHPQPGDLEIRIFYGLPTDIQEFDRRPSHFIRFEAHGEKGVIDTFGRLTKPAGHITLPPGDDIYTLIYESKHNYIQLDAEKFQRYLAEEGLVDALAERKAKHEEALPGQEGFARYVKALIKVGDGTTGFDRKIGMASELVALRDPFVGGDNGELEFQLWFLDKPAANAIIDLFAIDDKDIKKLATAHSDADGKVRFKTPGKGRFMVTGTTMRRASYPVEADWESFWTSITFEIESLDGPSKPASSAKSWAPKLVFGGVLVVLAAIAGIRFARRKN